MTVGFDAKRFFFNRTGLGNYSRSLVRGLSERYPDKSYVLYPFGDVGGKQPVWLENQANLMIDDTARGSFARSWWVRDAFSTQKPDIYHGLSNELPFNIGSADVRSVVTIHDLIFRQYPNTYPWLDRRIYNIKSHQASRVADRIIAVSESTKSDIVEAYGVAAEKISVVPPIIDRALFAPLDEAPDRVVLDKFNLPQDFLLSVGTIEKRKNLALVLHALSKLPKEERPALVVAGGGSKYYRHCRTVAKFHNLHEIYWLKYIADVNDLRSLYRLALATVYPSKYEGFGMPVVESLLSGTPVITSNTSSLPEAAGPGALLVDPSSTQEMVEAIRTLTQDAELRNQIAKRGRDYAIERFHPDTLVCQVDQIYREVLGQ